MKSIVLYRESLLDERINELEIIKKYFPVTDSMVGIRDALVIGRYSCIPFYADVVIGLALQDSYLINTFAEHIYVSNFWYYQDIAPWTPKTWFHLSEVPEEEAPFVLKGVTHSKKHQWNQMMYAETKADAIRISLDLKQDMLLGSQDILIRKFVKLKTYGYGKNDLPWTNEWRFFFYGEKLLSYGFYWTESPIIGTMNDAGIEFAKSIAKICASKTTFFVIDIGQLLTGEWIVIELNDAQISGYSANNPDILWRELKNQLI